MSERDERLYAAAKAYTDKSVEQLLAAPSIVDSDPDAVMQRHLVSMAAALEAADAVPGPACRVCGCTDDNACEGGCWWVEPDLCSACADRAGSGLQEEIVAWAQSTFAPDIDHVTTKLKHEFEELRGTLILVGNGGDPNQVPNEVADVMHMLFQVAHHHGFDLLEATRRKFQVNKQRTWEPQPDGTYQHVKGGE